MRAERGRCDGPAAAQPAHGTVSAAVLPGQLLHDSQPCPETGAEAGLGRRGGATTAAEASRRKKTTTMRTRAALRGAVDGQVAAGPRAARRRDEVDLDDDGTELENVPEERLRMPKQQAVKRASSWTASRH